MMTDPTPTRTSVDNTVIRGMPIRQRIDWLMEHARRLHNSDPIAFSGKGRGVHDYASVLSMDGSGSVCRRVRGEHAGARWRCGRQQGVRDAHSR